MIKDDLTYRIIGCAMKVHNTIGCGFQEVIYQRCLAIEMSRDGLSFGREVDIPIFYDGHSVGSRRADFVVANRVVVELKALASLENTHIVQAKNYVDAYGYDVGLLINFGAESLDYKRIFNRHRTPRTRNSAIPESVR